MAEGGAISKFYGGKQKRQWSRLEAAVNDRVKRHKKDKIPDEFKLTISGPTLKWKTFFRQQDAFQYARSQASDLHVFAFENDTLGCDSGQRQYLVTSYPVFWHYYRQLEKKHHYEVIPEGAVCKMYFDLEFMREYNTDRDGDYMVDVFIKYIDFWLTDKFGIRCGRDRVLDLDASTDTKFSRHLVYQIPGMAFKDNIHAGNFVHFVAGKVIKEASCTGERTESEQSQKSDNTLTVNSGQEEVTKTDLKSLMVKNKDGDEVLFCDLGVYTKNRNFRLYQSCKLGKNNPLVLSSQNKYSPTPRKPGKGQPHSPYNPQRQIFMDSIVANVQYQENLRILTFESDRIRSRISTSHSDKDEKSQTSDTVEGYHQSPYPELDNFISSVVQKNGTNGHIRHWTYFPQGEIILYEIGKYRWCENIGRPHKSNNIMLIADLRNEIYYQKCHDPDCRKQNFKSQDYPLPKDVLPSKFFDDTEVDFQDEIDDQDCLYAAMEIEKSLTEESVDTGTTNSKIPLVHTGRQEQVKLHKNNSNTTTNFGNGSSSNQTTSSCGEEQSKNVQLEDEDCWEGEDDFLEAVVTIENGTNTKNTI